MVNVWIAPSFFPRRLSQYVPGMQYASDVSLVGDFRVSFGAPIVATPAYLVSAQSIATAGSLQASSLLNSALMDAPFGRNVTMVLSGAGTGTVIIDGWDYLNQPVSESLAMNGATPVLGKKAFKYIRQITWTLVAATTMNVGCGSSLGLPFRTIKVWTEESNSGPVSAGTFTNPDLTVPATLTTGDTRGTYVTTTTLDGAKVITATIACANDTDAAGNGGLHGVPHYSN